ncbi:MAG: hypothetical protein HGA82_01090, partial [Anaerolineales bacterium]|nr:hypothetical protein [Anaerolineales bacterium]
MTGADDCGVARPSMGERKLQYGVSRVHLLTAHGNGYYTNFAGTAYVCWRFSNPDVSTNQPCRLRVEEVRPYG